MTALDHTRMGDRKLKSETHTALITSVCYTTRRVAEALAVAVES
jgi:hypothetical protein